MAYNILSLTERPELMSAAAEWFHSKWGVPCQEYRTSMEAALKAEHGVPAWYVVLGEAGNILAGIGVIENDFHKRPDRTPNLCALYVEEPFRRQGLARRLLKTAAEQLARQGIAVSYLITDHTDFYERCGWSYIGMVEENDGNMARMYRIVTEVS